jgi:SAM-dependent methyltransferase
MEISASMEDQNLYFKQGPNLAVYRRIEGLQEYWERRWSGTNIKALLMNARRGDLGELDIPFTAHLPRDGPILEAGCGPGRIVGALQARGYTVEGIDYAAETIARLQKVAPDLNVRSGDIFAVDRPDGYYSAYISLGVLEHEERGPEPGLAEAWRVLRPSGIALIMVPFLNRARRRIYRSAGSLVPDAAPAQARFYQYQFDPDDFSQRLETAGFKIISLLPLQLFEGLSGDYPLGRWLHRRHYFSWRLNRALQRLGEKAPPQIKLQYAHMLLWIAVRNG